MLKLTRRIGQVIRIGDDIQIVIEKASRSQVQVGIEAPKEVIVHREEIYERISKQRSTDSASLPAVQKLHKTTGKRSSSQR